MFFRIVETRLNKLLNSVGFGAVLINLDDEVKVIIKDRESNDPILHAITFEQLFELDERQAFIRHSDRYSTDNEELQSARFSGRMAHIHHTFYLPQIKLTFEKLMDINEKINFIVFVYQEPFKSEKNRMLVLDI